MTDATAAPTSDEDPPPVKPKSGRRIAQNITGLNLALNGLAILTGPLQARALGPDGRGQFAAIISTSGFVNGVFDLGLSTYVTREAAKGTRVGLLMGTIGRLAFALGLAAMFFGPFIAAGAADGRQTVFLFLVIGFTLLPLNLILAQLNSVNWAQQRWGLWTFVRVLPPVGGAIATVVLYLLDALTVTSAAIVASVLGLVATLPLLSILRGQRPFTWDIAVARQGLSFGSKSWLYQMASLTNARLDQVLMTRFVSSRELGLYAVAVNVTVFQSALRAGVISAIFPRVAGGDRSLTARACRMTMLITLIACCALAPLVGFGLPLLFGDDYREAVPMAQILLLGAIVQAGAGILSSGLTGSGLPGQSARGQLIALFITIPGLALLLGPLGGTGAAIVSVAAYSFTFAYLLRKAVKHLEGSYRSFLIPERSDLNFLSNSPLGQRLSGLRRRSK